MSKIIDEYIRLHKKDPNKLYLFYVKIFMFLLEMMPIMLLIIWY